MRKILPVIAAAVVVLAGQSVATAQVTAKVEPPPPYISDRAVIADALTSGAGVGWGSSTGESASAEQVRDWIQRRAASSGRLDVTKYPDGAMVLASPPKTGAKDREPTVVPDLTSMIQESTELSKQVAAGNIPKYDPATWHDLSGAPQPEIIINGDQRYRITNTTTFSSNSFGQLTFKDGTSNYVCSAYLYGNSIIMTAAHCVWGNGHYYTNFVFRRGLNGNGNAPYASCNGIQALTPDPWRGGYYGYPQWDYAAIKLNCTVPGTYGAGINALAALPCGDGIAPGPNGWANGYPEEKAGQQWEAYGPIYDGYCNWYQFVLDITGGQSGGPIIFPCSQYGFSECAMGHIKGDLYWPGQYNSGKRWYGPDDFAMIIQWRGY